MKTASIHLVLFLSPFSECRICPERFALITYAGKVNKDGSPSPVPDSSSLPLSMPPPTTPSHDGTSTYEPLPPDTTLPANGGYHSILLGAPISGMSAIDPSIFSAHSDAHLRVWFSYGVAAFEELALHRPFASVPMPPMRASLRRQPRVCSLPRCLRI